MLTQGHGIVQMHAAAPGFGHEAAANRVRRVADVGEAGEAGAALNNHPHRLRRQRLAHLRAAHAAEEGTAGELGGLEPGRERPAEEKRFFDGDLSLLCFLAAERAERYATVRNVLNRQGANIGKDAAKEWLASRERELARTANADYIEVI